MCVPSILVTKCLFCSVLLQSEDLLWNDYEEKLGDQIVRTMENYTAQFPEVKVTPCCYLCSLLNSAQICQKRPLKIVSIFGFSVS